MEHHPILRWARDFRLRGLLPGFLFEVTAELETHGGKNFCGEVVFTARSEALVERSGEHGRRSGGLDGGQDGPAAFAGVGDAAGKTLERRLIEKGDGGEVEQPGGDNAATAPDFGDVGEIEVVLIVLGIAERRGFGVDFAMRFAGVGVFENVEAFGVGGHQAVFNAIVNHFHEVAGTRRAAVEIAFFGGAGAPFAAGGAVDITATGSECFENGIEVFHDAVFAADHLAVAALEAPDAAAGADVNIVNAFGSEFLGAADVVDVVGVAAVDEDIVLAEFGSEIGDGGVDNRGWNHQPDGTGLLQLADKVVDGSGA